MSGRPIMRTIAFAGQVRRPAWQALPGLRLKALSSTRWQIDEVSSIARRCSGHVASHLRLQPGEFRSRFRRPIDATDAWFEPKRSLRFHSLAQPIRAPWLYGFLEQAGICAAHAGELLLPRLCVSAAVELTMEEVARLVLVLLRQRRLSPALGHAGRDVRGANRHRRSTV